MAPPSSDELKTLSLRNLIVLASRVGARVKPIINFSGQDIDLTDEIVAIAVDLASGSKVDMKRINSAYSSLDPGSYAHFEGEPSALHNIVHALRTIKYLAKAAFFMASAMRHDPPSSDCCEETLKAVEHMLGAADDAMDPWLRSRGIGEHARDGHDVHPDQALARSALRGDLDRLATSNPTAYRHISDSIQPSEADHLGALWPESPPSWWPRFEDLFISDVHFDHFLTQLVDGELLAPHGRYEASRRIVAQPLLLSRVFHSGKSADDFFTNNGFEDQTNITLTMTMRPVADLHLDDVALMMLYSSGTLRSVLSSISSNGEMLEVSLDDKLALLDPDGECPIENIPSFVERVVAFCYFCNWTPLKAE